MPVPGLNADQCQKRLRVAAKRGFEAVPMNFLAAPAPVGSGSVSALGSLPADDTEALARINALLDNGAEPLTLEDVWIHYAEAANTNFIPDRYAFMSRRTLKNIASDAATGFAFMNSHRTGGLSSDAELPYGRTFAGRYENIDGAGERTIIGFYMLRGVYPNGPNGPSTDTMHQGILGGTIFDVSVGLYGGQMLCDVCGGDITDGDECDHYPGTTEYMTEEEQAAQKAKGVPDGCCSYTMDDCHCGETSAVFDGAVPGAGFRKALAGEKQGKLSGKSLAQARHAFAPLLGKGDLMDSHGISQAVSDGLTSVLTAFGLKPKREQKAANVAEEDNTLPETTTTDDTPTTSATVDLTPLPESPPAATSDPEPEEDPVLTAAHQAGIHTVEQFAALQELANGGKTFLAGQREEAKRLAVVAFGNDAESQTDVAAAHAFLDTAPLSQVLSMASQFKRMAVKQGLQREDGKPMERRSASADLPEFNNDVQQPKNEPKGAEPLPIVEVYAQRAKVMRGEK